MSKKSAVNVTFVIYCIFLFSVLFIRSSETTGLMFSISGERIGTSTNIVPFKTIHDYLKALSLGNTDIITVLGNLAGNFILFLPMGILLPSISVHCRGYFASIALILLMILAVEALQLISGLGRFDIDDIILNLSGAVIGRSICGFYRVSSKKGTSAQH